MHTINLLNDLINIHARSLAVYLSDAEPWSASDSSPAHDVLAMVAADQLLSVDKLAHEVIEKGGTVSQGFFPAEFTGLHDLSMDYLVQQLVKHQRTDIERISRLAEALAADAGVRALADEALGAARGHLESFEELSPAATGV